MSAKICQAKYMDFVKRPGIVVISEDMVCAGDKHADACAGMILYKEKPPSSNMVKLGKGSRELSYH